MQRVEETRLWGRFQVAVAVHRLTGSTRQSLYDVKHDRSCQPAQFTSHIDTGHASNWETHLCIESRSCSRGRELHGMLSI